MLYKYDIDEVLRENFDISDKATRKYLVSLDEDDKSAVATALAAALYDKIVSRVDDINFGTIPKSMGDITKIDGYENTIECLNIIKKLVIEYKESTEVVDTVINAVENIKSRKSLFMKGFALKNNVVTTTYNLIVLAIEHAVSFLIAVCIEYIKNNDTNNIEMALDKAAYNNVHDNMLYEQLLSFNSSCGSGEFDTCFVDVINAKPVKEDTEEIYVSAEPVDTPAPQPTPEIIDKSDDNSGLFSGEFDYNEPVNIEPVIPESDTPESESSDEVDYDFADKNDIKDDSKPSFDVPVTTTNETGIATALAITGAVVLFGKYILKGATYIIKVLIPKLRNLSYFFISARVKLSDTLAIQSQLIELNAYKIQDNEAINAEKSEKIKSKQLKIADNLKKWSNKFAIENKVAEKKTKESIKDENKKMNIKDIQINDTDNEILF